MEKLKYASTQRNLAITTSTPLILYKAATPLFLVWLTLFLFPRRTALRNVIALPVIFGLYAEQSINHTSRLWGVSFCVGAYTVFGSLQAFNLLVAHDVASPTNEKFKWYGMSYDDARRKGWYTRVQWVTSLLFGSRGVGWGYRPKGDAVPESPQQTRLQFVITCIGKMVGCYLILDAYGLLMKHDPIYQNPECWSPFELSLEQGCYPDVVPNLLRYVYSIGRKFFTMAGIYALLTLLYLNAAVLFTTILPFTDPQSWPPLFGPVHYASTTRGFWGYFWHQSFRNHFSWPGTYLASQLKLSPKSTCAMIIKFYSAFICSGLLHTVGCYTQARNGSLVMLFFLLQPVGMLMEMYVVPKSLRGTWTMLWLLTTCNLFFKDFLEAGVGNTEVVPISIWRALNGEKTWRWGRMEDNIVWDKSAFGWGIAL